MTVITWKVRNVGKFFSFYQIKSSSPPEAYIQACMERESNSSFSVYSHQLENTSTFTEITSNVWPHFHFVF